MPPLSPNIKLRVVQTRIFDVALRIVEYFRPDEKEKAAGPTHDLSEAAYAAATQMRGKNEMATILFGPVAVLSIPYVSPEHLKAAMSVLAPRESGFPAPKRRTSPGYHEPDVQNGMKRLNILAARVEGKLFDLNETKWIGSIEGGIDGLRSQLIVALQSMGAGITDALAGAGKSLYFTLEGRRSALEDEENGSGEEKS